MVQERFEFGDLSCVLLIGQVCRLKGIIVEVVEFETIELMVGEEFPFVVSDCE